MDASQWRVEPGATVDLAARVPGDTGGLKKKDAEALMAADLDQLCALQEMLYVDGRTAVLLVLQGMDTSGKDGTIRHLSGGVNLLGAAVSSFKAPTETELRHDFLWRIHQHAPLHGHIGIFNRSHYEDVLIVRVRDLVPEAVWRPRYDQINAFESMLNASRTIIRKCFLHISKEEQRERLQARLDDPSKHWKFQPGDLETRAQWDAYQAAYEEALGRCSTEAAPWYVIPADHKWYRNYAVTRVLIETLESLDLRLPAPDFDPATIRLE